MVRRIFGNLARLLTGKAAAGVLSLGYMALATRALGPADYGVLILVHTYAMTVGGVIEFPGWHAIVRYGAQAVAENDQRRLGRLIAFAACVEMTGGALAVLVAAALAPFLGPRLGWSPTAVAFALPYSLAVLASIRSTPAGYLQLIGRFDLLGWHNIVAPLVRLAGAAVVLAVHAGLKGFLIAWLVAALAEWAAMWALGAFAARGRLSRADLLGGLAGVTRENPGLWRFMIGANADVTVTELVARIPPLALGWMLGPGAAGLYALAQRITSVLSQPALIFGQAAYVELARIAVHGERRKLRSTLQRAILVALAAAAPICLLVALFGHRIAEIAAGPGFERAAELMVWLALARTLMLAAPPSSAALTALGRPGLSVASNLVGGAGLLLLLPAMLSWLGLTGAGAHALLQAGVTVALLAACVAWQTEAQPALQRVET
ncbi:MAG TPA: lipopolysaccharide biosynthesis protein [Phenylobacterium sp.]|uniref:lipopolysaccharide biosynthesis protein n=1 Tax=Phenylobacterium sp. TaxID=1871053 RepID=UPI002B46B0CB|nr:lipopolysaccharide biosynthesis protein [Phenylobacterium sp.]HKR89785.1 lipopolysaccharide biosynthesis protein [Phenylobacterium sp.]